MSFEENCDLRGTDNVHGQISKHIFTPNEGYCLYMLFAILGRSVLGKTVPEVLSTACGFGPRA